MSRIELKGYTIVAIRTAFYLLALVVVATVATVASPLERADADLACEDPRYCFGELDNTQTVTHTFVLLNAGNAPVRIARVRTTCKCTTALPQKEVIAPGQEFGLTVNVKLRGQKGQIKETVFVETEGLDANVLMLVVEGTATESVHIAPYGASFGKVHFRDIVRKKIVITPKDMTADFAVTGVKSDSAQFDVSYEIAKQSFVVDVRTKPPLEIGSFLHHVYIRTNRNKCPLIALPVCIQVVGDLYFKPKQLMVSNYGKVSTTVTRFLYIAPNQDREFHVLAIHAPLPSIKIKIIRLDQGACFVQLSGIKPSEDLNGKQLRIKTDVPGQEEVTIPFVVR